MTAALQDYYAALKRVRLAIHETEIKGHEVAMAELRLDEERASVRALNDAEKSLCLAAKALAGAVAELPRERQPEGWGT